MLRPLHLYHTNVQTCHPLIHDKIFLKEDDWDYDNIQRHLIENVLNHGRLLMDHVKLSDNEDKPWWGKNLTLKIYC